jgi:hypothetical protein
LRARVSDHFIERNICAFSKGPDASVIVGGNIAYAAFQQRPLARCERQIVVIPPQMINGGVNDAALAI